MDVNILTPEQILNTRHGIENNNIEKKYYKRGIELEKGAIMTENRIEKNRELYEKYYNFFSVYPDLFLDCVKRDDSHFNLFFYQRLFLRMAMRYGRLCVIAPRAFSKSFISILALYLLCMFKPNGKYFIVAPKKEQGAKIAREKIYEIWQLFPLLKKEIRGEGNFGPDYIKIN